MIQCHRPDRRGYDKLKLERLITRYSLQKMMAIVEVKE